MANAIFGYFALPETVTDRIRRPFSWRRANPLGAFKHIGALPGLGRLMVMTFVYAIAFFVYPSVWAYFGKLQFGWGPGMIGLSLGMGPALQGIMSRSAPDNQQGELQGALTSINAVASIVAPLMMTQTFFYFTHDNAWFYLPGAPFLLAAVLVIASIFVYLPVLQERRVTSR